MSNRPATGSHTFKLVPPKKKKISDSYSSMYYKKNTMMQASKKHKNLYKKGIGRKIHKLKEENIRIYFTNPI